MNLILASGLASLRLEAFEKTLQCLLISFGNDRELEAHPARQYIPHDALPFDNILIGSVKPDHQSGAHRMSVASADEQAC